MPDILDKVQKQKFLQIEAVQVPLEEVPFEQIRQRITDPTTGEVYKGIVLQGVFADLTNSKANNNMRFYDVPSYLDMVNLLALQIHGKKGVYGELEHPKGYSVNYNNVSHKLIDIWYNAEEMRVYGQVLLLNTPKGKIAQEIIRSGGQLGISARAAGEEITNSDGTKSAKTKLLTTYDLVYHPGFNASIVEFKQLNESQQEIYLLGKKKAGFSGIIYDKDLKQMPEKYAEFESLHTSLNESTDCFLEWYLNNLNESTQQQKPDSKQQDSKQQVAKDNETLEDNQSSSEEDYQQKLADAAQKDLSEKDKYFQQMEQSQHSIKNDLIKKQRVNRKNKKYQNNHNNNHNLDRAYFDNSAGFMVNPYKLSNEVLQVQGAIQGVVPGSID